jgi:hypothetical protein
MGTSLSLRVIFTAATSPSTTVVSVLTLFGSDLLGFDVSVA